MISCAAIQKLERYGALGLKRHSTEDFVSTSLKDARRANIYALTLQETWAEAAAALRGTALREDAPSQPTAALAAAASARFTDALVYALSFAVALTTQHVFHVGKAARRHDTDASSAAGIFTDDYGQALALLTLLKETTVAVSAGRALRRSASSEDFTKAVAHLLTSGTDLVLLLLALRPTAADDAPSVTTSTDVQPQQLEGLLAQALVLVAATAQMLRRVQAAYPVPDLYHTRPCAALLKAIANKHKQQQQQQQQQQRDAAASAKSSTQRAAVHTEGTPGAASAASSRPLLALLRRYLHVCAQRPATTAAGLFSFFSLFQRLGLLHGALDAVAVGQVDGNAVQYWLSQLLSSTACNRATRYVVYFREDELRLMQQNVRQATDYALFTFATTPPVDPGLVQPLLAMPPEGAATVDSDADVTHARAALTLAQWCVSAPFFFESFCQDESWASFAQEQRRLVLLQQSRARRGLEKTSKRQQRRERAKNKLRGLDGDEDDDARSSASDSAMGRSSNASASSGDSDAASVHSNGSANSSRSARLMNDTASAHSLQGGSVGGSVTSLASRVSLLSTLSKHSAASYLSFISVLQPSTAGSVAGTRAGGNADDDEEGAANGGGGVDRQMHESEDGNTNLPLILLEQLTLGLHRFMEAYPAALLDTYGLRSVSWSSIARMFAVVERSLAHPAAVATASHLPQPQQQQQQLFSLAQDIRYNKGMGYEVLGLLFAKVVAPLLDLTPRTSAAAKPGVRADAPEAADDSDDAEEDVDAAGSVAAGVHSDGDRTEEGFFANAAAAAATVGRAVLSIEDDATTRTAVEAALSTCLTAYETVAPQVVDMNLATILRLAARTAATAAASGASSTPSSSSSWSSVLVGFVRDITARLGRSNDLPHLVDALLGRRDFARVETADGAAAAAATRVLTEEEEEAAAHDDVVADLRALRGVFALAPVRDAVVAAASTSLDPESLLLHLSGIATELEAALAADAVTSASASHVQRTLLALELMEALLAGVVPTSVSASAVLEQTTQLELLLTSSFMTWKERVEEAEEAERTSTTKQRKQLLQHHANENDDEDRRRRRDTHALLVQHLVAIRQCRAVTQLCLQDLGTQQVHDYLNMLEEALWQLTTNIGHVVGSLTLSALRPVLEDAAYDAFANEQSRWTRRLLLPSLVLQRLALARAVGAALGTQAGPAKELRELVAYLWDCLGTATCGDADPPHGHGNHHHHHHNNRDISLWLANQMTAQEWSSVVALGKEKHARASMTALLLRCAAAAATTEWMSCCLQSIPGTLLRALVDAFVSLPIEGVCDAVDEPQRQRADDVHRQWTALTTSLLQAYAAVGHNPYWPSLAMHAVRAVTHISRTWKRHAKASPSTAAATAASALLPLSSQLVTLLLCVLRSEPRAGEVLRKTLLCLARASAAPDEARAPPVLSRSGVSVAYVEAVKVPATALSDISVPATLAALDTADTREAFERGVAALQALTYEEELRELCTALYAPTLVKHLFTLTDLCACARTAAAAASEGAVTGASMQTLAQLYQIAVGAAQASWRAKATHGRIDALAQTPAVVFLHTVASTFHARLAAAAASAIGVPALTAFLAAFDDASSAAVTAAGEAAPHYLYVHIASPAAHGSERGRKPPQAAAAADGTAATTTESLVPGARSTPSALDTVEALWHDMLRCCAAAVMTASCGNDTLDEAEARASLQASCVALRLLVTQVWASAQHKQQQTSRGGAGGSSGGSSSSASGVTAHHRHSSAAAKRSREQQGEASPAMPADAVGPRSGMDAFIADLLSASGTCEGADSTPAAALRTRLADFFDVSTPEGRAAVGHHATAPAERAWQRLLLLHGDGAEAGVCAAWLLWKLQSVSATLSMPADTAASSSPSSSRWAAFLAASYGTRPDHPHAHNGAAAASAATRAARRHDEDDDARTATALRGLSCVLQGMAAEDAPPLLHDHMFALLAGAIPAPSARVDEMHTAAAAATVTTAAELLVQLFGVRPRLPAVRLLPLAQRLLVWLARALTGSPTSGLGSLSIRVCAAVAAHPAVCKAAAVDASPRAMVAATARANGGGGGGGGGSRHGRGTAGLAVSPAQELLDHVWLLLFRLLEETTTAGTTAAADREASHAPAATAAAPLSRPLLREPEVIQLVLLLTKTWMRAPPHPQVLWSRPAMLPPLLCAVFACVMRGMEARTYTPRVLNVLASGLAAMAAHVDAATASEGDADVEASESDTDVEEEGEAEADPADAVTEAKRPDATAQDARRRRLESGKSAPAGPVRVPAHVERAALAAATSALFEVAHHYVHVFTTYSGDMDFIFTDFLKVLGQHFLPTVTRPPVAHRVGVRIGGTTRSAMTFADLAYVCLGSADSKSLLKQAALRMEEEAAGDTVLAAAGAARGPTLTEGSRNIFRVD